MRSRRGVLSSSPECVICSTPERAPEVHTLVASTARACCCGVRSSPNTRSALEYMGEVSMRRAPPAKNPASTCASGSRCAADSPTSKGPEVPNPITGNSSPLEGTLRVSRAAPLGATTLVETAMAAAMLMPPESSSRRFIVSDERGVRLHHARGPALDHPREPERDGEHLRGIEGGGADLGGIELTLAARPLGGGNS